VSERKRADVCAFLYLFRIVYRDIKTENIGFDTKGDVKLFDFGLAKPLHPALASQIEEGMYNLTARTGTFPYMAPEVARKQRYNEKCDVFSFGILLWEILSLECAFSGITSRREFYYRISIGGVRPQIRPCWPSGARQIMSTSWTVEPQKRPSFEKVCNLLVADLGKLTQPRRKQKDTTVNRQREPKSVWRSILAL